LGTFEKLEENFCYHIVGSAAFTAWKFIMLGVAEGKESAFGRGNILSFCACMVPHVSGIVFHHLLQAFDKNLRGLECKKWLIFSIYPDFMLSSGSFLYTCAVIIQIIISQNNHVKKHNTIFFHVHVM